MNVYCEFADRPECKVKGIKAAKRSSVEMSFSMAGVPPFLDCLAENEKWKVYYMVKFLAATGCRASELAKLEKSCLKTGEFTLWTKGKIRKILIPKNLIQESREYFKTIDSVYLFPNRYRRTDVDQRDQQPDQKIRAQIRDPRGSAASACFPPPVCDLFLKQNKNIALLSDVLGHESLNTTAIYLRLSAAEQKKQIDKTVNW